MKKITLFLALIISVLSITSNGQEIAFTYMVTGELSSINLEDASQNYIGTTAPSFGGMDFGPNNVLYGIDHNTNQLYEVDTADASTTLIGSSIPAVDHIWTGLAYEPATGIMYGMAVYGIASGSSNLYTIDLTDGSVTLIGSQGTATSLACIAIDDEGLLYGLNLQASPKFYLIDKTDGSVTLLGQITDFGGAGMGYGMDFNSDNLTMYLTAYDSFGGSNSLYTVDLTDGSVTEIGPIDVWAPALAIISPFFSDFSADETTVCTGSTVNFTDASSGAVSWSWTFEGGTPATSTDQNPSVVYSTAGYYYVSLTVMNAAGDSETETKPNYMSVLETPAQADMPSGDDELCTGMNYEYSINTVPFAENYEWELTPASVGTIVGTGTEIELEVSDTWTGDFTFRVRATNMCGDGVWSDDLSGTVYMTPSQFDLIGGGDICEGDPGLEIELNNSETGVDYELYNNDVPTGNIVSGTGEGISFGLISVEGNYTAYGYTASCSIVMFGEASVIISLLPVQLSMPTGTTEVCNDDENDYTTTGIQGSDIAVWSLTPENAGTISSDGMTATISWDNTFEGTASLTVLAENSCGAGPASDPLEILVMASPTPEVSGDDLVCKNEVSVYSTSENIGNTYDWEVIGGAITAGEGTSEITVTWGSTPGQGNVIINESLELGCSAVDSLAVTIDDCTGIENNLLSNDFKVYPNPASSNLNLEFSAKKGEKIEISIFNSMGQLVMTKQDIAIGENQTSNFNIESFPKGMYLITIKNSEQIISKGKFEKN